MINLGSSWGFLFMVHANIKEIEQYFLFIMQKPFELHRHRKDIKLLPSFFFFSFRIYQVLRKIIYPRT